MSTESKSSISSGIVPDDLAALAFTIFHPSGFGVCQSVSSKNSFKPYQIHYDIKVTPLCRNKVHHLKIVLYFNKSKYDGKRKYRKKLSLLS